MPIIIFILVLNLYAFSVTESQVIILCLVYYRSSQYIVVCWCIIYFKTVQFCEFYLVQQYVTMFSEHRIDCAERSTCSNFLFYEVCGAVAALVFFEMPLVVDTEWNRCKYERYI